MYGHRNPFEFRLSTRLMFAAAMLPLVNLAPVNKGRAADDTLSRGNKNQMMIYGIVTRAFLYADDGNRSELFHVDGGVENTCLSWIAQGRLNEDITAGAHIELDAQLSNAAGDLNLIGTESTEQTAWGIRIQEVTATHRRYGKVSLGKVDTASTERVTVDFSGSDLAVGNNPADMAGGIHFYNRTTGGRTITIGDGIDKVDGIDKDNRIRYDFPGFGGVGSALSLRSRRGLGRGSWVYPRMGQFRIRDGGLLRQRQRPVDRRRGLMGWFRLPQAQKRPQHHASRRHQGQKGHRPGQRRNPLGKDRLFLRPVRHRRNPLRNILRAIQRFCPGRG